MTSILILILTRCLAGVPFSWFRSSKCMYYYYYYTMVDIDLHFNIIVLVPFKYYLLQTYSWMSPFIINMIINQTYKKHNEHVVAGFFFPFWGNCSFLSGGNIFEQVPLVRIQRPAVCLASRQNQHMVRLNSFDHNQTRGFVFHMLVSSFCSNVLTNLCESKIWPKKS